MKLVLFQNVHRMMQGEKLLKEKSIPAEVLPVPKEYSTECGMCIGVAVEHVEKARVALEQLVCTFVEQPSREVR